jgi:hypothetical protein
MVLAAVLILGLSAGIAGSTWKDLMQRSREEELFWRGDQYRRAIESFFETKTGTGGGLNSFPAKLEDLVRDPRFPEVRRHIRRLFPDPMTGRDWILIKNPAGRIAGVKSGSDLRPFRQSGFPEGYESFEGRSRYSDWEFTFTPRVKKPQRRTVPGKAHLPDGQ